MRKPKPHFYRFPTAGLFTDYRHMPQTELNVFRAARAFLAFDDMTLTRLLGLLGAWPMLPVNLVLETLPPWKRYNRITTEVFGLSGLEQCRQCVRLALNDGPSPKGYYLAGIAGHKAGPEMDNYIHDQFHETLIEFTRLAVERLHGNQRELDDKHSFEESCREFNLPCIETYLRVGRDGSIRQVRPGALQQAQRAASLFVKPALTSQGKGAERWDRRGGKYVESRGQEVSDFDALQRCLTARAAEAGKDLLVQELARNPSDRMAFAGPALSTIRLVTFRRSDGKLQPIQAGVRMALKPDAVVDNYHAGGAFFHVDHHTGRIGTGKTLGFANNPVDLTNLPGTDVVLTGTVVEGWEELRALALQLHDHLTQHTIGGWDLALTDRGAVAVECNSVPGTPASWQRSLGGFLNSEFAGLMRDEIVGFLDRLAPADSRFRFEQGR